MCSSLLNSCIATLEPVTQAANRVTHHFLVRCLIHRREDFAELSKVQMGRFAFSQLVDDQILFPFPHANAIDDASDVRHRNALSVEEREKEREEMLSANILSS